MTAQASVLVEEEDEDEQGRLAAQLASRLVTGMLATPELAALDVSGGARNELAPGAKLGDGGRYCLLGRAA